jgi:hypothetical protein
MKFGTSFEQVSPSIFFARLHTSHTFLGPNPSPVDLLLMLLPLANHACDLIRTEKNQSVSNELNESEILIQGGSQLLWQHNDERRVFQFKTLKTNRIFFTKKVAIIMQRNFVAFLSFLLANVWSECYTDTSLRTFSAGEGEE